MSFLFFCFNLLCAIPTVHKIIEHINIFPLIPQGFFLENQTFGSCSKLLYVYPIVFQTFAIYHSIDQNGSFLCCVVGLIYFCSTIIHLHFSERISLLPLHEALSLLSLCFWKWIVEYFFVVVLVSFIVFAFYYVDSLK